MTKTEELSKRKAAGRNYAYNHLNLFRCKGCGGKAGVVENRTRVHHSMDCPIFARLYASQDFIRAINKYRQRWN